MIGTHLNRSLFLNALRAGAVVFLLSGADALAAPAAPANAHAKDGDKAEKKEDKKEDKAEKKADKDEKKADAKDDHAKAKEDRGADRAARKLAEHKVQREKLSAMLKGPMDASMKQELRRHAERTARLERIKVVATEAKDTDAVDRATKLLAKEQARHDKWMGEHAVPILGGAAPANADKNAPADKKGGAQ